MPSSKLKISDETPSAEEFNQLRESAGWSAILPTRHAATALKNSLFCISARQGGELVGMVRVLGDSGYAFCIQDVIVAKEHQSKGIGTRLMQRALTRIDALGLDCAYISLLSTLGREGFYTRFGFAARPDERRGAGMSLMQQRATPSP